MERMDEEINLVDECQHNFDKHMTRATQAFDEALRECKRGMASLQKQLDDERAAHQETRATLQERWEATRRREQDLEEEVQRLELNLRQSRSLARSSSTARKSTTESPVRSQLRTPAPSETSRPSRPLTSTIRPLAVSNSVPRSISDQNSVVSPASHSVEKTYLADSPSRSSFVSVHPPTPTAKIVVPKRPPTAPVTKPKLAAIQKKRPTTAKSRRVNCPNCASSMLQTSLERHLRDVCTAAGRGGKDKRPQMPGGSMSEQEGVQDEHNLEGVYPQTRKERRVPLESSSVLS